MKIFGYVFLVCITVIAGCRREEEQYRQGNIRGGRLLNLKDYVALHSDNLQYLYVGKRKYIGVRGKPPYYLSITNVSKILFVTEWNKKVVFHVVDPNNGDDIQIDGEKSWFGNGIGVITSDRILVVERQLVAILIC